jgi:hypothetical protein
MSWKKWPKSSNRRWSLTGSILAMTFLTYLSIGAANAAEKLQELQANFDRESHAASKIKQLQKLGEAQFAAATRAQKGGSFGEIGLIFEKYRDNVRAALELLKKQDPNADKHPQGYRHLELQARRGIREVEDIIVIVPEEVRPPMEIVREDLIQIDDELIKALFPRRTREGDQPQATPSQTSPTTPPPQGKP